MLKSKILAIILVISVLLLCSCSLFGGVADEGEVTVVVETSEGYEVHKAQLGKVENKDKGALGVLEHLSKEKNGLSYDADETDFITAIGSIEQDPSAGAYVMVYTSVKTDSYEGAPTVQYGEMTLYQSGVGVKDMTVEDKTVILFRLEVYEF